MKNTKINNINNEERRRSGATGTGITQKNLQLGNTNNGKKALEKLAEKGRAHFKLDLGTVRLHIRKCGDLCTRFLISGRFKNVSFVSTLEKVFSEETLISMYLLYYGMSILERFHCISLV